MNISRIYDLSSKSDMLYIFRWLKYEINQQIGVNNFRKIIKNTRPNLSNENLIENLTQQLEEKLDLLKTDFNH